MTRQPAQARDQVVRGRGLRGAGQQVMISGAVGSKALQAAGLECLLKTPGLGSGAFETPESPMARDLARPIRKRERAFAGRVMTFASQRCETGGWRAPTLDRVPTLIFWSDGRELARMEGALASAAVRAQLEFLSGTEDGHVGSAHTH